ncbi:MAG: hypothetical protein O8C61_06925 [Candidatus Methanoperedens sp.]|nr:hypothetical protein [Candidatus Methanoperedens sp.]
MIDISTILPLLVGILILIGIIGGLVWIWKKRNWSILKKATITIILAVGVFIAFFALFAITLFSSDQAIYFSQGSNLGKINYDEIISNAQKAGYRVDGPYYVNVKQEIGVHPPGIKELDERFGADYRFLSVGYFYSEKMHLVADQREGGTDIFFFNEDRSDEPFKPEYLPPDEWIIEKFRLMFGTNEQDSRNYLTQLKDSIIKGQEYPGRISISIKKDINIPAVYSNLKGTSSNSSIFPTTGEGLFKETFYSGDKKIGVLDFLVPNVRIILQDKAHEYTINIDRLGGVATGIKFSPGEKIPEEEYRGIFKQMFVNLGLPPENLDELKFE